MYQPPWIVKAGEYLGVHEVVGPGSHPDIMRWAKNQAGWIANYFKDDDTPWCALFVNGVLQECGIPGTNSLAAASFCTWGQPMADPSYGCILVFSRPGGNHVGFYLGERADAYRVRGGNQGNAVKDEWIPKARLRKGDGIRWVPGVDLPFPSPVILTSDGQPASLNEA